MSENDGRRDPWVMSLVGLFLGLGSGAFAIVVRRFFATEWLAHVVAVAGVAAALVGLYSLARSFAPSARALWRPRATALLLFAFVSLLLSVVVCGWLHTQTLKSLADRSQKIVDALYGFRRDQTEFPATLEELVPRYLRAVPGTAMRGDPPYHYARDERGHFELWIELQSTGEGTRLFYRSGNDYPPDVEVLRAWGFVE